MTLEQKHINPILAHPEQREEVSKYRYIDLFRERTDNLRFREYIDYDDEGFLLLNGDRVSDIVENTGLPAEIVDTRNVDLRAKQWINLSDNVAKNVGYRGKMKHLYAAKASPTAEIVSTAMMNGFYPETSSEADVFNLFNLIEKVGVRNLPRDFRVVSNGLKIHPNLHTMPQPNIDIPGFIVDKNDRSESAINTPSYYEMIMKMRTEYGVNIIPVLDSLSELRFLVNDISTPIDVGLRYKNYGDAKHEGPNETLVSRHGMTKDQLFLAADEISGTEHLNLTMFHAMVGAGETIPVDKLVDSLMDAADIFFQLKMKHPSLNDFNMGGGMAPLGFGYDHEAFLTEFLSRMQQKADQYGMEAPNITFEFGSYIAAESGFHVFDVIEEKSNSVSTVDGEDDWWTIISASLIKIFPDMLILGRDDVMILPIEHANEEAVLGIWGDETCDSDGRYPPKISGLFQGIMPRIPEGATQGFMMIADGAYGKTLSGENGVSHSGQTEPIKLIIYLDDENNKHIIVEHRQTLEEINQIMGFGKGSERMIVNQDKLKRLSK